MRWVAAAAVLATLAACQPPPRPFAPAERAVRAAAIPAEDAYGVTLRPLTGMAPAMAEPFAAALVAALEARAIPALVSAGPARGALVHGAAEARPLDDGRVEVAIEWSVVGRDGRGLGRHRVAARPPRSDREGASAALVARLAADSADAIAALLRGPALPRPPPVRVGPVAAPPGIDGGLLRRAMVDALRAARIDTARSGQAGPLLTAAVSLGAALDGRRRLLVAWRLDDEAGRRIGALVQENDVADGTAAARWPATVRLIARAAVDEIGPLLARARPVDGPPRPP